MATVKITKQILDGNLGDGWSDNYEAASAYAEFIKTIWRSDLSELSDAGHEIDFSINVQRNASGYTRNTEITALGDDCGEETEIERAVESALTSDDVIWTKFCDSDVAARLVA